MSPTFILSVLLILLVAFIALKLLVASVKMAMRIGMLILVVAAAAVAYFEFFAN